MNEIPLYRKHVTSLFLSHFAADWKELHCRLSYNWIHGLNPEWWPQLPNPQHFVLPLMWHLVMYCCFPLHFNMFCLWLGCKLFKSYYMYVFRLPHKYVLKEVNLDASDDSWNLEIFIEHTFECIIALNVYFMRKKS